MSSRGFRLEAVGLLPLRAPRLSLALFVAFSAVCVLGTLRLSPSESISDFFRSATPEYLNYQKLRALFPASESDVLAVVEGDDLLRPDALENIRTLHQELGSVEVVRSVFSLFSIREPPDARGDAAPVVPAELPEGAAFETLAERLASHPLIEGTLLSRRDAEGQLGLLVISLKPDAVRATDLATAIGEIEKTARQVLEGTDLEVRFTGAPVMHKDTLDGIAQDRLVLNTSGFLVGLFFGWVFFRRVRLMLIVALSPPVAALWALGLLGFWGQEMNIFINVVPAVVIVITYCDAMHLVFDVRRQLRQGKDRFAAARHAINTIGPACVLTSLTTSLALLSLVWSDSALISNFGLVSAFGVLVAFFVVITLVPLSAVVLIRDEAAFARSSRTGQGGPAWLDGACAWLGGRIGTAAKLLTYSGIALLLTFLFHHLQLEPRYRIIDQVSDGKPSIEVSKRLDDKLGGTHPVSIVVQWPENRDLASDDVVRAITEAHDTIGAVPGIGAVGSIISIKRWLTRHGGAAARYLPYYLRRIPKSHAVRLFDEGARAAVVTGRIGNLEAGRLRTLFDGVETDLEKLRGGYPGFEFTLTGLSVVLAVQSSDMITQLNQGLMIAMVIVIALIAAAFRSWRIGLISILPNVFPVVAAGTYLHLSGQGLQYASIIGLTVAFGLAVDDTIHFLHRFGLEQRKSSNPEEVIHRTLSRVGPVLIVTTAVLVCGVIGFLLSDFGATRLFGTLFMVTLIAALVADMVLLPALILFSGLLRRFGG